MTDQLTGAQRRALTRASRKAGARIAPRFTALGKDGITPDMAQRLLELGWVEEHEKRELTGRLITLHITDLGTRILNQPIEETITFLHQDSSHGYTDKASSALLSAGEVLTEPSETWKRSASEAAMAAKLSNPKTRRDQARRISRAASGRHGWRTNGPVHPVSRRVDPAEIRETDDQDHDEAA
jgi:hypothetical protein